MKRSRDNSTKAIDRRVDEGRGQGCGANYRPWLRTQDVPSTGLVSRIHGQKTKRVHHLLSMLETQFFYTLEWNPSVRDIREQFPLLPLEETLVASEALGIRHPTDPKTQEPIVMTTDFLVPLRSGLQETEMALCVKPSSALTSKRRLEKLELERRYFESRKTPWAIVTEREISPALARNVEWLHSYFDLAACDGLSEAAVQKVKAALEPEILAGQESLAALTSRCDNRLGLTPGASLSAVRHLLATRIWTVNMDEAIQPNLPLRLLNSTSGTVTHATESLRKYAA